MKRIVVISKLLKKASKGKIQERYFEDPSSEILQNENLINESIELSEAILSQIEQESIDNLQPNKLESQENENIPDSKDSINNPENIFNQFSQENTQFQNDSEETQQDLHEKRWKNKHLLRNDFHMIMNLLISLFREQNQDSVFASIIPASLLTEDKNENNLDDEFHDAINNFNIDDNSSN